MIADILSGNPRAIARAATLIENQAAAAEPLLQALAPHTGRALVIGVTGPPGAGKSTLVDRLALAYRQQGLQVGIIAVDPTSPYTGGAILGDRIRMQRHHADPGVFIRSMATRGSVGGLARATAGLVALLDAAGYGVVLIETVGVGQDEVEIARLAGVTLLTLVPSMGDDVQALKAGVMEIADVFVINKSDLPGADRVEREIKATQGLSPRKDSSKDTRNDPRKDWTPPIVWTVATEGTGLDALLEKIQEFRSMFPGGERRNAFAQGAASAAGPYLDHLGIAVRSVDQALEFYENQLGFPPGARETVAEEKVNVAMLPAGSTRIELLEATEPDSVIAKFIDKRGEGLHHIAIRVPDLDAALDRLRSTGARLMNEPRPGAGGHLYVFVHPHSTGGVLIELIQR